MSLIQAQARFGTTPISILTPEAMGHNADLLAGLVRDIADYAPGITPEWLIESLVNGVVTGWLIDDRALGVTEIQMRPSQRVLFIAWLAGEGADDWLGDWLDALQHFAEATQCAGIELQGRRGFARKFPALVEHFGFKPLGVLYRAEVG